MGDKSKIQWTDATWNPVTGCTKVSAGCKHCYAETFADRHLGSFMNGRAFTDVQLHPDRLDQPRRWRRARMIFVNSMSDLFHEKVPFPFIDQVVDEMMRAPHHTYQVLTKRALRMLEWAKARPEKREMLLKAAHIWWGVSAEAQPELVVRWDSLSRFPAAVRFLSLEPLLDVGHPIDFQFMHEYIDEEMLILPDWVIVGGESGRFARPCRIESVREIVRMCRHDDVPVFVKQLGSNPVSDDPCGRCQGLGYTVTAALSVQCGLCRGERHARVALRHTKGGDIAEWAADLQVREWPRVKAT